MGFMDIWSGHRNYSLNILTVPHQVVVCLFTAWIGGWLLPHQAWVRRHPLSIGCYQKSCDNNNLSIPCSNFPTLQVILRQSARTILPTIPPLESRISIRDNCRENKSFKFQVFEGHLRSKSMLGTWKVKVIVSGCAEYGNQDCKCSCGCPIQLGNFCWME